MVPRKMLGGAEAFGAAVTFDIESRAVGAKRLVAFIGHELPAPSGMLCRSGRESQSASVPGLSR